jgi:hypothetical protein
MEIEAITQDVIVNFPLYSETRVQQRIKHKAASKEDGIDLEYVNKVLTEPPYSFPFVKVEEFTATILKPQEKAESAPILGQYTPVKLPVAASMPTTVTFKRTEIKQPQIKKSLSKTIPYGRKYAMELQTTRTKSQVDQIRNSISPKALVKLCKMVKVDTTVLNQVCEEIEKEAAQ